MKALLHSLLTPLPPTAATLLARILLCFLRPPAESHSQSGGFALVIPVLSASTQYASQEETAWRFLMPVPTAVFFFCKLCILIKCKTILWFVNSGYGIMTVTILVSLSHRWPYSDERVELGPEWMTRHGFYLSIQGSNTINHTLFSHPFYTKWNKNSQNEHRAVLKRSLNSPLRP